MVNKADIIQSSALMLAKHFADDVFDNISQQEELEKLLAERIVYLMLHDMEKLLAVLYRIDVNEQKVKDAFAMNEPEEIAPRLAELIIEREIQKARSRAEHKNDGG